MQPGGGSRTRDGGPGGFGPGQGVDAFSALYVNGTLVDCVQPITTTGQPSVPGSLTQVGQETYRTVGSSSGNGSWRVLAQPVAATFATSGGVRSQPGGAVVVVAVRTGGLDESLRRLVRIELGAAAGLLAALAARRLARAAAGAATVGDHVGVGVDHHRR